MDKQGRVIGFMRECRKNLQFSELDGRRWIRKAILYQDRIRIESPEGLCRLGRCR